MTAVERALIQRLHDQLYARSTTAGHLAQIVTHEHLGYCAWNRESPLCVAYRALLEDSTRYLNEHPESRQISLAEAV